MKHKVCVCVNVRQCRAVLHAASSFRPRGSAFFPGFAAVMPVFLLLLLVLSSQVVAVLALMLFQLYFMLA
jgi:hypothetical protein